MDVPELPPEALQRIRTKRKDAERQLEARITEVPESQDFLSYVDAFRIFCESLFDHQAEEYASCFEDGDAFEQFCEETLIPGIVEEILPHWSLSACRKAQSEPSTGTLRVVSYGPGGRTSEVSPEGELLAPARVLRSAYSIHGDWEYFIPGACRFALRFLDTAKQVQEVLTVALQERVYYWVFRGGAKMSGRRGGSAVAPIAVRVGTRWPDIEFRLTGDHMVQIYTSAGTYVRNYAECGLENRRSGKPNTGWELLCKMIADGGRLGKPERLTRLASSDWRKKEKQVQRLRAALRKLLPDVEGDPIARVPYGYQLTFKPTCARSYEG